MGRETKILLALLATLAGVFVGVLSMKLLVPRPPVGAGPDVDVAATEPHELVAPPTLSPLPAAPGAVDRSGARNAGFPAAAAEPAEAESAGEAAAVSRAMPRGDPFVTAASLEQPLPPTDRPPADPGDAAPAPSRFPAEPAAPPVTTATPPAPLPAIEPPGVPAAFATAVPTTPPAMTYVATAGDSWWNLAERAYGDGRLYRALFAWNRVVDPRVTLAPGTRLEIPPRERLEAAWPKLAPPR